MAVVHEECKGQALIYCRTATVGQQDMNKLEAQARACVEYATSRGYTVGRVTHELASGGSLADRPLLARDHADLAQGNFQALVVYSIDRLSRDRESILTLVDECEQSGITILSVTDPPAWVEILRSVHV